MANQPPGLNGLNNSLSYMGVNPGTPPNFQVFHRAPTTNDSKNFLLGSFWEWQEEERVWILVALAGGIATWQEIVFDAANEFVTDAGTAIPVGGVLNVLGTAGITTTGAGNTVTVTNDGTIAVSYVTDAGTAIPALGILDVSGGLNIYTAGAGNTVTINLDTSISQPNTSADATQGVYSLGGTRFMHAFGTRDTFLGSGAGNLTLTGNNLTGIGYQALESVTTAVGCVALGTSALTGNVSSDNNTALGSLSLSSLVSGNGANTAVGGASLEALTGGAGRNTSIGNISLSGLLTGSDNVAVGFGCGTAYTGTESSNILVGNITGTIGDNNTIRIGSPGSGLGDQNACYVAGIYGQAAGSTNGVVVVDNSGKLGESIGLNGQVLIGTSSGTRTPTWANITSLDASVAITNGPNSIDLSTMGGGGVAAEPFYAYLNGPTGSITGDGTVYTLGTSVAFAILYDVGGNINVGGGGNPLTFTAPATGYYQINSYLAVISTTNPWLRCGLTMRSFSSQTWALWTSNYSTTAAGVLSGGQYALVAHGSVLIQLNAGDYVFWQLGVGEAGQPLNVAIQQSVAASYVSGYRVA